MAKRLDGKTALVTGGARGLGRAFCEGFASEGAAVIATDILDCTDTARAIEKHGRDALAVHCNLSLKSDIDQLVARVNERFGGCDILMHCAAHQPHELFEDIDVDEWRTTMSVNLESLLHLGQAFLPAMKTRGWGRIISITSTTFYDGTPSHAQYVTSKAGLIGLTRVLSKEVGLHGITVNAIAPGLVRTENSEAAVKQLLAAGYPNYYELICAQQAIKRTLVPADLVGPAIFLASDEAACITGQTILVDGGWQHV